MDESVMHPRKRQAVRQGSAVVKRCVPKKPSGRKDVDHNQSRQSVKPTKQAPIAIPTSIPAEVKEHIDELCQYPLEHVIHWLMIARYKHSYETQLPALADSPIIDDRPNDSTARFYACTFCNKSFGLKGVWKRHEETFHELQRKWDCPTVGCNQTFTAENKFIQHHQNHHGCEKCPHVREALKWLPRKSGWGCGYCGQLLSSWDERIDHIASHLETGLTKESWDHTSVIQALLSQPKFAGPWSALLELSQDTSPILSGKIHWDQESTKALQLQLEHADSIMDATSLVREAFSLGLPQDTDIPVDLLIPPNRGEESENRLFPEKDQEPPLQHVIPPKAYIVRSYLNSAPSSIGFPSDSFTTYPITTPEAGPSNNKSTAEWTGPAYMPAPAQASPFSLAEHLSPISSQTLSNLDKSTPDQQDDMLNAAPFMEQYDFVPAHQQVTDHNPSGLNEGAVHVDLGGMSPWSSSIAERYHFSRSFHRQG